MNTITHVTNLMDDFTFFNNPSLILLFTNSVAVANILIIKLRSKLIGHKPEDRLVEL